MPTANKLHKLSFLAIKRDIVDDLK